jgi:hypothetical protein
MPQDINRTDTPVDSASAGSLTFDHDINSVQFSPGDDRRMGDGYERN